MALTRTLRTIHNYAKSLIIYRGGPVRGISGDVMEFDQSASKGQITSHTTNVRGNTIHFLKTGHGNRLVFLLPGMLGSGQTDFLNQLNGLNKDIFTVFAWDPPGYGKSRPPDRTWPKDWFSRDAELGSAFLEVMQREDKSISDRKFSLLGWSDGGITACIMAACYPQQVDRLIAWGAAAYVSEADVKVNEGIRDVSKWSKRMRNTYLEMYEEDYLAKHCAQWCDAYNAYADHSAGDLCQRFLPDIKCPTLIIHGQKDVLVGQFHADYLHGNIANSRLLNVPDGKHNLHMKYHLAFNSVVEQFIINPSNVISKM